MYLLNYNFIFQLSDVDSDTIQRQRRELQLLIGELKDRDRYDCCSEFICVCNAILSDCLFLIRELNDMVQAHQKQIVAWEEDRQRVSAIKINK